MCGTCGCHSENGVTILTADHDHHHHPSDDHTHDSHNHHHTHAPTTRTLNLTESVLAKNDRLAERNRGYFLAKNLLVLNVISSPGSGKTTLLQATASQGGLRCGVVVGDLETDNDAQRFRAAGIPSVQITTGTLCHLEADMVLTAAQHLDLDAIQLLIVENVGNLVCPAAYDLGETLRVVLLSTTEGEDKPLKYPTLFKSADVVLLTKLDIAEAVGFDQEAAIANIQAVNPTAKLFTVSAKTGLGLADWYQYLEEHCVEGAIV
ncbi:hydrogenase nickel incorporation protein HypB [Spirulina major CS-329]|uniref:hydrogenase nickel incorporation protein HypB n=1 Tax=Spirulina TaxID=1154 RepID=UPI00233156BE|nr:MULTISPECIES: hydrogenase nickel incorporation protein HypB [Spirulina]MDB9495262.1 hydrogenase nickel incorporation protein HypB [Spirulina subsalsa CS-330]MDB9503416.1 hydrogenase nickel incorporation protein HypB [Spirulina major CS-329]